MADEAGGRRRNFLLGRGERLTEPVRLPRGGGGEKAHPYSFAESRDFLAPRAATVRASLDELPAGACPGGDAVAVLTLHPAYLGKSYFPDALLYALNAISVGSRARELTPRQWGRARHGDRAATAEIFVAAGRASFRRFARDLPGWTERDPAAPDLRKLEDVRVWSVAERLRPVPDSLEAPLMEVVLHAPEGPQADTVLDGFKAYVEGLDLAADFDRRLHSGGLCFMPVRAPRERLEALAAFAFLRVARPMPTLRVAGARGPARRVHAGVGPGPGPERAPERVVPPDGPPLDATIRVAVFDGGCNAAECEPYVRRIRGRGVGAENDEAVAHGTKVTSALLFGPVPADGRLPRPYATVDHYRIVDDAALEHDEAGRLYDVLPRIRDVLLERPYEFVNISVAPDVPADDDHPHPWTTVLDEVLADGATLATIAAGNLGAGERHGGSRRICPPADCVNGMTVGACDSVGASWSRAPYSSTGPGRSPGIVKPDVVTFGGSDAEPFRCVTPTGAGPAGGVVTDAGTSFASPAALRMGLGVRAHLGPVLSPLAVKALLIHACPEHAHSRPECGWGRVPDDLDDLLTVDDHAARVVYQGRLTAKQWLRVPIPMPTGPLTGMVTIQATLCFASPVDPQDPINYTRAGLEVVFRPHAGKQAAPEKPAKSKAFFRARGEYLTEHELRNDHHKWETTLSSAVRVRPDNLLDPVFDVHYHARETGRATRHAPVIPYALVVTASAPAMPDFYNRVVRRYRTQLEQLVPVHEIPVRTRTS